MNTLRMIVLSVTVLCLTIQRSEAQVTVQAGIDSMPPARSIISVKAKPSGALNGNLSGIIVTVQWLTSYNITLTLLPNAFGIDTAGRPVGTFGPYSYRTFATAVTTPINWAANSENELFTARADGNPDTGSFYLTNAVPGNTRWYFESAGNDITNSTTPFYRGGVGGIRLPVQLSRFIATVVNQRQVRLDWTTISEINNYGFFVERKRGNDSLFTEIPNSFIPGHGTTNETHNYTFTDQSPGAPTVWYRLRQVDLDGTVHYTEPIQASGIVMSVEGKEVAPIEFALKQNYPNPFNPSTEIKFSVEKQDRTTLEVFNIIGQKVATLFDDVAEPGQYYKVRFGGGNLASGIYLYRLQSGKRSDLKKLLLLK